MSYFKHFSIVLIISFPLTAQTPVSQENERDAQLYEAQQLNQSVVKLFGEGKLDEAYSLAQKVVKIREQFLSKDDETVLAAVYNLGSIQYRRGKYSDARQLFERVLRGYEKNLGADDVNLSEVLDQLAVLYYGSGQVIDSEHAYQRSLAIREKALGKDHAMAARSVRNLAEFYQFEGEYKKAEPLYQRLLEIRKSEGKDRDDALERYACLLRKTGRLAEAENLETQASGAIPWGTKPSPTAPISGGVLNGKALNLAQPLYPEEARSRRVSGKVSVRIVINESGNVIRACAVSGPPLLMRASESAAYRSKFTPTMLMGSPVRVSGTIFYKFVGR